jgi:hypothetical protein
MTQSTPRMTLYLPASQMAAVLAALTAFCVQQSYAFLHTFHSEEHADCEIFTAQQQCLLRLTLQTRQPDGPAPGIFPPTPESAWPDDMAPLLRQLAQLCTSA